MRNLQFIIEGKIPTKKNQLKFNSKTGSVYYPQEVKQYKRDALLQLQAQFNKNYRGMGFDCKVSLSAAYFIEKDNRDLNNINAIVWDCLQEAGVIRNDKDIMFAKEIKISAGTEKVFIKVRNCSAMDFNLGLFMKSFQE